ncbi:MAG TPA: permease [Xanthobacteraceae bacterium]|jgi:ABC-2 type transport system permease protein|nr:permease [Xanthobacteraceae bacterium]
MTVAAGTATWFVRHEARLAWRDWFAMMTGGRRKRLPRVVIALIAFVIFMHVVAQWVVGPYAEAQLDKATLIAVSGTILLSWLLMISQAMESMTRAFYSRADLDLILSSPVAAERLFAIRIGTVALTVAMMALPLAGPFIDILILHGGWHWLGAYAVIVAMGAAATAFAVTLTIAMFRAFGAKRTRLLAQVVAAVIGAAFVIGLQIVAILSFGTLSRTSVLQSEATVAHAPDIGSFIWWPARAAMGDIWALAVVLVLSFILLAVAIALVAPRFGEIALIAASSGSSSSGQSRRAAAFRPTSPLGALRRKEWTLLRRDPWLVSQSLMQMLYLIPPAVLLWRSFEKGGLSGAYQLLVPVLVMAAGQLAGGLAWLAISGEDAPDLVASAPIPPRFILRAKIEAVLGVIAAVFAPLIVALAIASPWHAMITAAGVLIATTFATAIQLWFRSQAKRSQFRRRQVSSRLATFAEAFSSIGWAATAAVAAASLGLAVVPAILTLLIIGGAWCMSPRVLS